MRKKKLGNKYVCFQCGCKFYDLGRSQPICPKCGADQTEAKKKPAVTTRVAGADASSPAPPRHRKRKVQEEPWDSQEAAFDEEESEDEEPFDADGLSLVEEEELDEGDDAETP